MNRHEVRRRLHENRVELNQLLLAVVEEIAFRIERGRRLIDENRERERELALIYSGKNSGLVESVEIMRSVLENSVFETDTFNIISVIDRVLESGGPAENPH